MSRRREYEIPRCHDAANTEMSRRLEYEIPRCREYEILRRLDVENTEMLNDFSFRTSRLMDMKGKSSSLRGPSLISVRQ